MVGAENVTVTDVAGEGDAVVGSRTDARTNNNDARVWIKPCTIIAKVVAVTWSRFVPNLHCLHS